MTDAHHRADPDAWPPAQPLPSISRRRMLGVSLGAGLGLSAATSIRLLLAADTAHADAAVAAPPAQERTLKMDMQRSQASVLMQAGDIRTVSPALERYLQG